MSLEQTGEQGEKQTGRDRADAACEMLEAGGWKCRPDYFRKAARCYYKRFDTPTGYRIEKRDGGMQVCIAVSTFSEDASYMGYEMDVTGELPDGTWVKVHNWAMPDDILEGMATIPRLLAAWESLASHK